MEKSEAENNIPPVIHYVWLGGKDKPDRVLKCIESWKRFCPDFELKEWNETNFDINCNNYLKEAYDLKQWAFASDYIRLAVLARYGGIYLDSDVEVVRDLSPLLRHEAFFGFEHSALLESSTFGCVKNHRYIIEFLDTYKDKRFIKKNGKPDTTANTEILTALLLYKHGLKLDNTNQELQDGVAVYSNEYFCPKHYMTGKIHDTPNTYCIHLFDGSWLKTSKKRLDRVCGKVVNIIGEKQAYKFSDIFYKRKLKKHWKNLNKNGKSL